MLDYQSDYDADLADLGELKDQIESLQQEIDIWLETTPPGFEEKWRSMEDTLRGTRDPPPGAWWGAFDPDAPGLGSDYEVYPLEDPSIDIDYDEAELALEPSRVLFIRCDFFTDEERMTLLKVRPLKLEQLPKVRSYFLENFGYLKLTISQAQKDRFELTRDEARERTYQKFAESLTAKPESSVESPTSENESSDSPQAEQEQAWQKETSASQKKTAQIIGKSVKTVRRYLDDGNNPLERMDPPSRDVRVTSIKRFLKLTE